MKKILFVTTNKHKVFQARKVFSKYNICVKWIKRSYDEASDDTVKEIAEKAARNLADELKKPIMVEDTGVLFDAYPGFPGAFPKFVFNHIGYEGIFRLLKGKSRKARFISCVGYCRPGKKPLVFTACMKGRITEKVFCRNKAGIMPYERIFIPENQKKVLGELSFEEKFRILHRAKAFRKLAGWLREIQL